MYQEVKKTNTLLRHINTPYLYYKIILEIAIETIDMRGSTMNDIIYPKRIENRLHIRDFEYAEPEDIFHVHDVFVLLYRFLFLKKRSEKADNCTQLLLCTVLELYGWKHIPLYVALKNPQSTYEDIKGSRSLRFHQEQETEELKAINIYWSYHDALLKLPFSWYRPGILAGDVFCHI